VRTRFQIRLGPGAVKSRLGYRCPPEATTGLSACDLEPILYFRDLRSFRSVAPQRCRPIRERNFPSHGSLKPKRGVGERPESPRLGCLPRLRPLRPPLRCPPTPRSRFRLPYVSHYRATWRCEFRMKFQLSPATGCSGSYRRKPLG